MRSRSGGMALTSSRSGPEATSGSRRDRERRRQRRRPGREAGPSTSVQGSPQTDAVAPWHFLYLRPEPHGQGAFRPILSLTAWGASPELGSSPWLIVTRWV